MEVQVAQLSPVLMELSVTVEVDRVKKALDVAYADLQRRARVRGFRPGKAPREVLTQLYGGSVLGEVASKLVDETLNQALADKQVQPLSQPKVEVQSAKESAPLVYKARFEVKPDIAELKWEGLSAEKPKATIDDATVEKALESLRVQHSTLVSPESARAAKKGDVVTIDFEASVEGKSVDQGKGVTADLGEGRLVKELEAGLEGMAIGETKAIVVAFPDNHANPALRGKSADFKVTLTEVKERKLPALDDELAKDVGDFADLAALRADVRAKLEKQASDEAEQVLVTNLVNALCAANTVETPPSLVQQQMQITYSDLVQRARRMGQREVPLTQELAKQLEADSVVKVKAGLLMAEIARINGVIVNDDDLERGLNELAAETGKNVAKLRVEYRDENKRQMLIGMILEDKVLDLLIAKADVKEVEASAPSAT
jgi:trigger factor